MCPKLELMENYSGPRLKAKEVDIRRLTVLLDAPKVPMPGIVSTKAPMEATDISKEIPADAAVQTSQETFLLLLKLDDVSCSASIVEI